MLINSEKQKETATSEGTATRQISGKMAQTVSIA